MKLKVFLRPALAIVFGFVGAFIARGSTPMAILAIGGDYFLLIAFLAFAALGFILPDILELAGRAGIAELARQIAERIPNPYASRLNVPKISFRKNRSEKKYVDPMVVDTSALIDARIAEVVKTGFLSGTILVIPSVIEELHRLADSADDGKRMRGRRGLDCLNEVKRSKKVRLAVLNSEPKEDAVDTKLLILAKKTRGRLITVDFNLNKVAKVRGITTLNVNELANALKMPILPSDKLFIRIVDIGKGKGQGVGYLDDGTMVVVEEGAKFKGKAVDVSVHRVLQTAAGQMIFAKMASNYTH